MFDTLMRFHNNFLSINLRSLKRKRSRNLQSFWCSSKSVVVSSLSPVWNVPSASGNVTPTHVDHLQQQRRQHRPINNTPRIYCPAQYFSTDGNDNKQSRQKDDPTHSTPKSLWDQMRSLPNMITLARMASTPLLCYWIVQEDYALAISGCALAAISDGLDGYVAKHYGGSTVLGTYLDPLADKALINGLAVSLWYANILPTPLVALWATKDVVLLSGTAWYLQQQQHTINFLSNSIATQPLTVAPSLLGKLNTGLQFITLAVGILTPVVNNTMVLPPEILQSLCWVTAVTTVGSVLSYTGGTGVKLTTSTKTPEEKGSDNGKYGKEKNYKSWSHKS
jgi:phosphatidylglycerophosphate synthase